MLTRLSDDDKWRYVNEVWSAAHGLRGQSCTITTAAIARAVFLIADMPLEAPPGPHAGALWEASAAAGAAGGEGALGGVDEVAAAAAPADAVSGEREEG